MSFLVRSTVVMTVNEAFSKSLDDVATRNMVAIENTTKSPIRVHSSEDTVSSVMKEVHYNNPPTTADHGPIFLQYESW